MYEEKIEDTLRQTARHEDKLKRMVFIEVSIDTIFNLKT